MDKSSRLLVSIVALLVSIVVLYTTTQDEVETTQDEVETRPVSYFEVDGMPCIETKRGISCDWSKWEGER